MPDRTIRAGAYRVGDDVKALEILEAGGLVPYAKRKLAQRAAQASAAA
jgi:hypothetical protein